jgi:hypothetical protein
MSSVSRRWLLGVPAAAVGAGAVMRVARTSGKPRWAGPGRRSPYLTASSSPVYDQSFAAFADHLSVGIGDELVVRARSGERIDVVIERVTWEFGTRRGERMLARSDIDVGAASDLPHADWPVACRCVVDTSWRSGLYVAVVMDSADRSRRRIAPFVVRAKPGSAPIVVGVPFTTYHAYNAWGGASMYPFNSPNGVARQLPIARPFDVFDGAGFMFYGDWQLARWLES